MAKILLLLSLLVCIETGAAVRLSQFKPLDFGGTQKYIQSLPANDSVHSYHVKMVYYNETFFYHVCYPYCRTIQNRNYIVSKTSLTSLITTHQPTNSVHTHASRFQEILFVLNDRVYLMILFTKMGHVMIMNVLVWEDTEGAWRSLNGSFPYLMGIWWVLQLSPPENAFSKDFSEPDTIYFCIMAFDFERVRYEFFRLKVSDDRVQIDVAAAFTLQDNPRVCFFTVRNGQVMALLDHSTGMIKYTMTVSSEGLAHLADSSDIAVDFIFGLENTVGYRIGDFALFYRLNSRMPNLQMLDLDTMKITSTDVKMDSDAIVLVDEIGKRLFAINRQQQHQVAFLVV